MQSSNADRTTRGDLSEITAKTAGSSVIRSRFRHHWLRGLAIIGVAVSLLVGIELGPTSQASASTSISVPVPSWLAHFLVNSRGEDLARQILQAQGYTCLPFGVACYIQGSYDPPRWAAGTVNTGGPPYVNARAWPRTDAPVIRTFPNGWRLVIFCQTTGQWIYGRWGWTNVWDYVGQQGDAPRFVSDGFVYTGSNGFVAGDCAATNYGSG
jgi:hypothetical protein